MKKMLVVLGLLLSTVSQAKEGAICNGKLLGVEVVMPDRQVLKGDGRELLDFLKSESAEIKSYINSVEAGKACGPQACVDGIMAIRQGKIGPIVAIRVRCRAKEKRT